MSPVGADSGGRLWRETVSRYAPLSLRTFLGVTFAYAGIDKLSDPDSFGAGTGFTPAGLQGGKIATP